MTSWILLLRGINVGGRHRLPMKELVQDLQSLNLEEIKTYIQSGNVVFRSNGIPDVLEARIAATIEKRHGFKPEVFLISEGELAAAVQMNPFPKADDAPKTLHLYFLASEPTSPDFKSLTAAAARSERFHLQDRIFYLYAPGGIGRSKLAQKVERALGVPVTARNWRTVKKLLEMTKSPPEH